jgi:hypothetical protein
MADSDANTGRADHVHEAAHTALLPHRDGRWWDGFLFAAPSSPLGHQLAHTRRTAVKNRAIPTLDVAQREPGSLRVACALPVTVLGRQVLARGICLASPGESWR